MDDITQYGLTQKLAKLRQQIVDLEQPQQSDFPNTAQYQARMSVAPNLQESIALARIWAQMEQLSQTIVHEKAMARVVARLRQTLDIETIFGATTQGVRQILSCDRVVIFRFGSDWSLELVAESVARSWISLNRPNGPTIWRDTDLQTTQGGKFHNHERSAVNDIYRANLSDCHVEILEKFQIRAYLIAPVFVDKKLWGLLAAHQNSGPRVWKQQALNALSQIGNQLGVGLQQANLFAQQQKAREKAEAENRAKSDFLAYLSHELRTPLNSILGFSQVLARDSRLSPTQHEHLGTIVHSGEYLVTLLSNILAMSKLEAGGAVLHQVSFDLYELLNRLKDVFQLQADSKGLELIFDYDANLPQFICTDQGKLRQVLINLLSNAVKFTQTGYIIVRVKVEDREERGTGDREQGIGNREQGIGNREQGTGNRERGIGNREKPTTYDPRRITQTLIPNLQSLIFEVEDTGSGIAAADLDRLFNPFVQTEVGMRSHAGTGLGLAICHQLVDLMGGAITVESVLGHGSVFRFNIRADLPQSLVWAAGCHTFIGPSGWSDISCSKQVGPLGRGYGADHGHTDYGNPENSLNQAAYPIVMATERLFQALASMPDDWLKKLRQAALSARETRLFELIEQIPVEQRLLNQFLSQLVNTLQFDQIVDLTNHAAYGSRKA